MFLKICIILYLAYLKLIIKQRIGTVYMDKVLPLISYMCLFHVTEFGTTLHKTKSK